VRHTGHRHARLARRHTTGLAVSAVLLDVGPAGVGAPTAAAAPRPTIAKPSVVYQNLRLVNGDTPTGLP
jgi:hypothetical protein